MQLQEISRIIKKKQSKDCNEKKIVCHSYVRTYNIT